jgi:hypothetical protein
LEMFYKHFWLEFLLIGILPINNRFLKNLKFLFIERLEKRLKLFFRNFAFFFAEEAQRWQTILNKPNIFSQKY